MPPLIKNTLAGIPDATRRLGQDASQVFAGGVTGLFGIPGGSQMFKQGVSDIPKALTGQAQAPVQPLKFGPTIPSIDQMNTNPLSNKIQSVNKKNPQVVGNALKNKISGSNKLAGVDFPLYHNPAIIMSVPHPDPTAHTGTVTTDPYTIYASTYMKNILYGLMAQDASTGNNPAGDAIKRQILNLTKSIWNMDHPGTSYPDSLNAYEAWLDS